MPVDPDIPYPSAKSGSCSQLLQTEARLSTVDLRPFLTQTKDTDIVVESWCIRCKERTRTSGGGNQYVDIFPRWTGGAENLLHVEREPTCLFLQRKCHGSHPSQHFRKVLFKSLFELRIIVLEMTVRMLKMCCYRCCASCIEDSVILESADVLFFLPFFFVRRLVFKS